jgi:hypothetical protein
VDWINLAEIGTSGGFFEYGNEPSASIKYWEALEWLHSWQLLQKG